MTNDDEVENWSLSSFLLAVSLLKYSFDFSQGLTILCDSSSIRLISSGNYENSVTITTEEAMENDMDYENNVIMVCPGYT